MSDDGRGFFDDTDGEFDAFDGLTDDEVAEDLRYCTERGGLYRPLAIARPDPPEIRLAKKVLIDKGKLIFNKIATDKNGEVYEVVRRKGESKPGIVKHDGKTWKFYPAINFNFTTEELDELCSFMEELI